MSFVALLVPAIVDDVGVVYGPARKASLPRGGYVDGELSEAEFERKLDRLVANDSVADARAERERRAVVDDAESNRY